MNITTEADWDLYDFGNCQHPLNPGDNYVRYETNGIVHETAGDCNDCCPADWTGAGWYCMKSGIADAADCSDRIPDHVGPVFFCTQAEYDVYQFSVCQATGAFPLYFMHTTDGIRYDSRAACVAAGCAWP